MTRRQKQLLDFIIQYQKDNGTTPSYQEMAEGIGIKSKSTVCWMMRNLKEQGFVTHIDGKHRAIEVKNKTSANKLITKLHLATRFIREVASTPNCIICNGDYGYRCIGCYYRKAQQVLKDIEAVNK